MTQTPRKPTVRSRVRAAGQWTVLAGGATVVGWGVAGHAATGVARWAAREETDPKRTPTQKHAMPHLAHAVRDFHDTRVLVAGLVLFAVGVAVAARAKEPSARTEGKVDQLVAVAAKILGGRPDAWSYKQVSMRGWGRKFESATFVGPHDIEDGDPTKRAAVSAAFARRLDRPVTVEWFPQTTSFRVTVAPPAVPVPAVIPHPATPVDRARPVIWFGQAVDQAGTPVGWDLTTGEAHMLMAATTGDGKSICQFTIAVEALRQGCTVVVCDRKRVSLLALRGLPGVEIYAVTVDEITACLARVRDLMESRYDDWEAGQRTFQRLVVIIEEASEMIKQCDTAWRAAGGKGDSPASLHLGAITAMGRQARVHVPLATQRPDAKVIGGDTRGNFAARLLLGNGSEQHRRMTQITTKPSDPRAKGRGIFAVGESETEVQVWWTGDPSDISGPDLDLVRSLLPATPPPAVLTRPTYGPVPADERPDALVLPFRRPSNTPSDGPSDDPSDDPSEVDPNPETGRSEDSYVWLTTAETMAALGVSGPRVSQYARAGRLNPVRRGSGRALSYREDEVAGLAAELAGVRQG